MTYRVVMSVVYVPSPMLSISLLVIHLALGCELLIAMVVWPSFWWWRVILCCRVQNKNTLTYCIYTYIRCCYAVSCETRLNLNFGCLFVVLDLLDSVVWSLFNRISFLGHVLIWTIPLCWLAFVEIDFGRISIGLNCSSPVSLLNCSCVCFYCYSDVRMHVYVVRMCSYSYLPWPFLVLAKPVDCLFNSSLCLFVCTYM